MALRSDLGDFDLTAFRIGSGRGGLSWFPDIYQTLMTHEERDGEAFDELLS